MGNSPASASANRKGKPIGREIVENCGDLKPGDHVCWRRGYFISHHAIVESVNSTNKTFTCIEYTPEEAAGVDAAGKVGGKKPRVERKLHDFKEAGPHMFRIKYENALPFDETLNKARERLSEKDYSVFSNNCEHFARFCKTGNPECEQLSVFGRRVGTIISYGAIKAIAEGVVCYIFKNRGIEASCSMWELGRCRLKGIPELVDDAIVNVVRCTKVSALKITVIINALVELILFAYEAIQKIKQYNRNDMKGIDLTLELVELVFESGLGCVCGTFGGLVGQAFIPVPFLGGMVGAVLGSLAGRLCGSLLSINIVGPLIYWFYVNFVKTGYIMSKLREFIFSDDQRK